MLQSEKGIFNGVKTTFFSDVSIESAITFQREERSTRYSQEIVHPVC